MVDAPQKTPFQYRFDQVLEAMETPGNRAAWGRKIGVASGQTLYNWYERDQKIPEKERKRFAAFGISIDWINDNEGEMRLPTSSISAPATPDNYVRFPLLEGFVAAGEGGYVPDYPEVVQYVEVAKEWAKRNIHVPHSSVRVITARGDSMTGDLDDGDVLFVDSRVQGFDADAVYVLNWQGRPLVKRLQARMDGSVAIRSSNPAYETEIVARGEVDQLYISGRVVAAWAFKKF